MSDQALHDAIARAINAADGGPANADDWSRQAADAVLGLVAEQIARERAELAHGVQYAKGYLDALADAQAAIEAALDPGKSWDDAQAEALAVVRRLAEEAP